MAEKKNFKKKYIVVFQDEDGNVLKTSFVPEGEAASPPEISEKKGETEHYETLFSGWNADFSKVENNLVVKAVYEEVPKKYLVMYFHENDKLLGMESVAYGSPAKAKLQPAKAADEEYEYIFSGWSCPLSHIEGDTRAKAVFEKKRKVFTVRFFCEDDSLLREEQVEYGEKMHPPAAPEKKADAVYHYEFEKWSEEPERITKNVNIYAVFRAVYNEYTAAFYDGEKLLREERYHYGDILTFPDISKKGYDLCWHITFPDINKKGYDLCWSGTPEKVERSCEIHARWTFSNPVGKEMISGNGTYRIVNPSVKNGTVVLTKYMDEKEVRVVLPDRVKLGDYYYTVEGIGANALAQCTHMEKLCLPDSIIYVEERGLAGCRFLRRLWCGESLRNIGAKAFAGDVRLKEIFLPGNQWRKCHKKAFEGSGMQVRLYVSPSVHRQVERVLEAVHGRNKIQIIQQSIS